jgi:DNA-directed RNA polymerase specialized sigma24 family protein
VHETPHHSWTEPGRDPELALAAQRGDLGALFTLLRKYRRELWRVCFALTLDRLRAERLVHDTLLRAAKNLRSLPTGSSMLPWLVRLAAHLATAASRQGPPTGGAEPFSPEALGTALTEIERPVLEAFATLPEGERLLLALDTIEHIPYPELAVIAKREVPVIMNQVALIRSRIAREEAA